MKWLWHNGERVICVALFLAMTAVGFVNVVVRYVTNYSFAATEELLLSGFLLLTVFGAAIAAQRGEHLAVTFFYELLPVRLRKLVFVIALLLSLLLLLLAAWYTLLLVMMQFGSGVRSYALRIPAWYYTAAVPLGFVLVAVRLIERSIGEWRELNAPGA